MRVVRFKHDQVTLLALDMDSQHNFDCPCSGVNIIVRDYVLVSLRRGNLSIMLDGGIPILGILSFFVFRA